MYIFIKVHIVWVDDLFDNDSRRETTFYLPRGLHFINTAK